VKRPNVVLVVMDAVRADVLEPYGAPTGSTPHLAALAETGCVFEEAFAAAPWTPPSHASLFTGVAPARHGVDVDGNLVLGPEPPVLAEILARHGYRTFGVLPDVHLSARRGFDRGFQETVETWRIPYAHPDGDWLASLALNALLGPDKRTRYTNRVVRRWLAAEPREPFFVFVNYKTAHNRYQSPRPFRRRFERRAPGIDLEKVRYYSREGGYPYMAGTLDLTEDELALARSWYRAAVAYLDSRLGELLAFLEWLGTRDRTLVVVTADHGEHFGEHRLAYHLFSLYEELIRVPLVMAWPGRLPAATRVPGLVSLIDVLPTLLGARRDRARPGPGGPEPRAGRRRDPARHGLRGLRPPGRDGAAAREAVPRPRLLPARPGARVRPHARLEADRGDRRPRGALRPRARPGRDAEPGRGAS
jgi:arylsulfatase A-like enzyme